VAWAWLSVLALVTWFLGSEAQAGEVDPIRFRVDFMDAPRSDPKIKESCEIIEAALRASIDQATQPTSADKWLVVYISDMPTAPGEDFFVRLVAVAHGQEVGATEPLACVACGPDELTTTALGVLPPMLEALAAAEPPPVVAPTPEPVESIVTLEPARPAGPNRRALQISGTVTATTGAVLLGVGAGLAGVGHVHTYPPISSEFIDGINYTPPGVALASVGGAMLVAGLVCFGLGLRKPAALVGVAPVFNAQVVGGNVAFAF